ncbi:MAG TPA: CHAD domain-containing protein [Candidatus Sumerlaeota bacterium]|nr:MAG: CHAD domain protein [candidate division BRC1 bacterium ADurb.Bin183]HOE64509.1 CHAD domain-containing protein [Candidatus Sumerlaeota bacterium]HRR30064.1 CHAD domain-containing protein [Candidatus Sumerlaeia bacterium]HON51262.1 CHAD domain-containing protein [Candidatus Sumerlaeota bacterium]HOR64421.1 CHAD domain-containing protein [Candidatus Sumerlaeota bacterium]
MNELFQQEERQLGELMLPLLKKYREQFNQLTARLKEGSAPDDVHDLRVVIRRLRSLLVALKDISPKVKIRSLNNSLGNIMKPFGNLRDLHIQREILTAGIPMEEPLFDIYMRRLNKKIAKIESMLRKKIQSADMSSIDNALSALGEMEKISLPRSREMRAAARRKIPHFISRSIMQKFLWKCFAFFPLIPNEEMKQEFHKLRIAVKKLRYKAEIFQPILKEDIPSESLALFRDIQDAMGETHDYDVTMENVADYFSKKKPEVLGSPAYKAWIEKAQSKRHELYLKSLALLKRMEAFDFIRPKKKQVF